MASHDQRTSHVLKHACITNRDRKPTRKIFKSFKHCITILEQVLCNEINICIDNHISMGKKLSYFVYASKQPSINCKNSKNNSS